MGFNIVVCVFHCCEPIYWALTLPDLLFENDLDQATL